MVYILSFINKKQNILSLINYKSNKGIIILTKIRNVRRDVTAWIGWQRSHRYRPVVTRQKRCFYKGQSLT